MKLKIKNPGFARKAYKDAAELKLVKRGERRVNGSPVLLEAQVYVTNAGTRYHPYWCEVIEAKWDNEGKGIWSRGWRTSAAGRRAVAASFGSGHLGRVRVGAQDGDEQQVRKSRI